MSRSIPAPNPHLSNTRKYYHHESDDEDLEDEEQDIEDDILEEEVNQLHHANNNSQLYTHTVDNLLEDDDDNFSESLDDESILHGLTNRTYQQPEIIIAGLAEREEVAKAAFKTWFRINPGNKEIKDRWWALYYKKIDKKFHLRDNHLGRKINGWIEEDLYALERQLDQHTSDMNVTLGDLSFSSGLDSDSRLQDNTSLPKQQRKRKPNSSKDGVYPAYLNVELVHPPSHLLNLKGSATDYPEHSAEYYALKLREHCMDQNIDWQDTELDDAVSWFKDQRNTIMEEIPSLSSKKKFISDMGTKQKRAKLSDENIFALGDSSPPFAMQANNNQWIRTDIYEVDDVIIIKVDLPGLVPNQDFILQLVSNKLILKGERKPSEIYKGVVLEQKRHYGKFVLDIELPLSTDTSQSEQTFCNGVLTVKFPTKSKDVAQQLATAGIVVSHPHHAVASSSAGMLPSSSLVQHVISPIHVISTGQSIMQASGHPQHVKQEIPSWETYH